jgi:hypothetical protein
VPSLFLAINLTDPVFLPAIFGLLGVVIGALLTAGSTYLLEIRREEREIAKEDRDRAEELRKAARLVQYDLSSGSAAVKKAADEGRFFRFSNDPLAESSWPTVKTVFARSELSTAQWNALTIAVRMIALFKGVRDSAIASGKTQINAESQETFKRILSDIQAAHEVLNPFI